LLLEEVVGLDERCGVEVHRRLDVVRESVEGGTSRVDGIEGLVEILGSIADVSELRFLTVGPRRELAGTGEAKDDVIDVALFQEFLLSENRTRMDIRDGARTRRSISEVGVGAANHTRDFDRGGFDTHGVFFLFVFVECYLAVCVAG
jgi:hypothetical protein